MKTQRNGDEQNYLDAVITWVDGSDKTKQEKLEYYIQQESAGKSPNVISSRFNASGEIKYCVLSIFRFAPFVRNIYIVTDGQRPDIDDDVVKYFPERISSVKYLDHIDIFENYEEYLPLFNSRAIETMLWNIPGISDRFIYFNDDFFIVKKLEFEDCVVNDKLVLRGRWNLVPVFRLLWYRFFVPSSKRRASFHTGQWNAAKRAGYKLRYFVFEHTPYLISKSLIKSFYDKSPEVMRKNISFRFRNPEQYNPCSLSAHLCLLHKKAIPQHNTQLSYLQPYHRQKNYIQDKFEKCENNPDIKFMCVQDLSLIEKERRDEVFEWLHKTIIK